MSVKSNEGGIPFQPLLNLSWSSVRLRTNLLDMTERLFILHVDGVD